MFMGQMHPEWMVHRYKQTGSLSNKSYHYGHSYSPRKIMHTIGIPNTNDWRPR